jgi:C4-dicarboxylate transporter, DctM subunit
MKWLDTISTKINTIGAFISGSAVIILGIIVTYDVIMRYVFHSPTVWVADVSMLLCIASVFFAVGYAMKEKSHISVTLIIDKLSNGNRIIFSILSLIFSGFYCCILVWKGTEVAIAQFLSGELTGFGLRYPIAILRAFIPLGALILLVEVVNQLSTSISQIIKVKESETISNETWLKKYFPPFIFLALLVIGGAMCLSKGLAPLGLVMLLFVLIFGGTPVAFTMGLIGFTAFQFTLGGGLMLNHIPMVTFNILTDFVMIAIPLFIFVSAILSVGEIGSDLYDLANKFVGHLPGGLAVATILSCAVFAAISGSSTATALAIGIIAIPEMTSKGYNRKFVFGTVAAGGVLGPLIPPSLYLIIIGGITGDSVGKLFMGSMMPGIVLALIFTIYILIHSIRNKDSMPKINAAPWGDRWRSMKKSIWGLLTPVIILGGIYSGIMTPTEAAAVGVVYGLIICLFIYRTLPLKKMYELILSAAKLNALLMFLIAGAMVFGQVVALLGISDTVCEYLSKLPFSPITILFFVIIFLFILGCLMDAGSILLITYPILYQIFVKHFGFDSIWFAVIFVIVLEVGLLTPPFGLNIFVVQGIDKSAKYEEVVAGLMPFVLCMILLILLTIFYPPLVTWLARLVG